MREAGHMRLRVTAYFWASLFVLVTGQGVVLDGLQTETAREHGDVLELQRSGECQNTAQGRSALADDKGFVCSWLEVDPSSRCCPWSTQRYMCKGCDIETRCCDNYEYCVACCLDPQRTVEEVVLQYPRAAQQTSGKCSSVFEYCSIRCRHNSQSVVHENAYKSELHHCFGAHVDLQGDESADDSLEGVSIAVADPGQSCDAMCASIQKLCRPTKLAAINKCHILQQHFACSGLCISSTGRDQPAEVVSTAPRHLHPGACLVNANPELFSCDGSHPSTRRLCPCSA